MVVVAKEVAESVHGQAFEFSSEAGAARTPAGGFHRNHDVAEKNPIASGIGFTLQGLHVKAQYVGGAVEVPEFAIERPDLVIASE